MKNEKGVTLVELLAAIVLLTLIITVFLQFLPQLATTNKKNVEKNQAINLAESELLHWKEVISNNFNTYKASATQTTCSFDNGKVCFVVDKIDMQDEQYNQDFYVSINLHKHPEDELTMKNAHHLHIEIKNRENDAKIGEAFGFVYLPKEE